MNLLVLQEQHFFKMPNGEVWVKEQSDYNFWERYLNVFDEITVCARFQHKEKYNTKGLLLSSRKKVNFIELPDFRGVKGLIKNYFKVKKIIKNAVKNADRIIFRAPSPISLITYPIVKKYKKIYAIELMNNPYTHFSPEAMHHFYQPIVRKIIVNQTKSLCINANGVAYVTNYILQEMYPCHSIIYGENTRYFDANYSTISLKKKNYYFKKGKNKLPKVIKIINTGKMEDNRKGQDVIIKTIFYLRKKGYNVEGILVGDGEKRCEFEQLAKELKVDKYIKFPGWISGFDNLKKELRTSHFGIFPSVGEGLPRSLIEAMSQGLLCFGSNVDGIKELLDDKFLVSGLSAEKFADNISYFIDNFDKVEYERKKQFEKSKEYEYSILQKRRNEFYSKLKNVKE